MTKEKELKIIRIISDTEFIMNGGTEDDISNGDLFEVRDKKGEKIVDLDGELLGYLGGRKAILEVTQVHDNFSVLRSEYIDPKPDNYYSNALFNSMKDALSLSSSSGHYEHLSINIDEMEPLESSSPISKGDILKRCGSIYGND